jgi:tRNA A-37 threonylcarbamoyl transferase component Bud32
MQKAQTLQCSLNLYKTHSKQIKDLNVISESLKLVQENLGKFLEDMSKGYYFLNGTSIDEEIRERVEKWG